MTPDLIYRFEIQGHAYGILLMDNHSHLQQSLFLTSFYKSFGFRPQFDLTWFKWFYLENPLGQCNNYVLIDVDSNNWIGGFGFAKKAYLHNGVKIVGGLGVNGFINPGYEGQGLYTTLISVGLFQEHFRQRAAFSFPFSGNFASIKGHLNSGWQSSIDLCFLESKTNLQIIDDPLTLCKDNFKRVKEIDLGKMTQVSSLYFSRTHDELEWRYVKRPDKQYKYVTINSGPDRGYMILGDYVNKNGSKRCEIADYRYNSLEAMERLIRKARIVAAQNSYDAVDVLVNPKSICHKIFSREGFHERGDGYTLLTYSTEAFTIPDQITLNYGDFDVV